VWSNLVVDTRGRLLAIDYGEKNIGLAYSDALGITVQPLPSIRNSGRKELNRKLKSVVDEMEICMLIVGMPLNMDGSRNESVLRIEKMIQRLKFILNLPLVGVDERLSTVEAEEFWNRMNTRQKKKYRTIDSLAAALILERYLRER
jgi:putative Holliday junction resolvase